MGKSLVQLAEEGDKRAQRKIDAIGYAAMLFLAISAIGIGIALTNIVELILYG